MAETTFAEPTTQVIPDIDYSPTTSGTISPVDFYSGNGASAPSVGLDGRSPSASPTSASPDIIDAEWRDVTPEPFQSNAEWSAEQRAKWRAEDEQRIQQAQAEAAEYDRTIRDIDAATPKKGNSNPRAIGRAAAGAAGAISGVAEAIDRRANGAGWGESIGAGIGNALGGITGGALGGKAGLAAGTASTANPAGAGVGLAVGGALGGVAGSEIGAAIGGGIGAAIDNLFPGQDGNESGADDLSPVEGDAPATMPDPNVGGDFSAVGGVFMEFDRPWGQTSGFNAIEYGEVEGRPGNLRIVSCVGNVFPLERYIPGSIRIIATGFCYPAPEQEPQTRPQPQPPQYPDAPAFRLPDFDFGDLFEPSTDRPPTTNPGDRPRFEPIGAPDTSLPEFPDIPGAEPEPAPRPEPQPSDEPLGDIPGGSPQTGLPDGGGGTLSPTTQPPGAREIEGEPVTSPNPIFSNPPGPVDFPSTGDGLEPIDEPEDFNPVDENQQPEECDPCKKLDEVLSLLKDNFSVIQLFSGCEDDPETGDTTYSSGPLGSVGLSGITAQNQVILQALAAIWDKVKCESEAYASVPDAAPFKVPNVVPQLALQFKESGSSGGSRWHITIPRFNEAYKDALQPFTYQKGNYRCGLELTDNSKIIVNAITEAEGRRVIAHCLQFVRAEFQTSLDLIRVNKIPSRDFRQVQVVSCYAKYFAGRLDEPPQWVRKIR